MIVAVALTFVTDLTVNEAKYRKQLLNSYLLADQIRDAYFCGNHIYDQINT